MAEANSDHSAINLKTDICPLCDKHCDLALPCCNKGTAFKFGLIDGDYKPMGLRKKLKSLLRHLAGLSSPIKKVPN